MKQVRAPNSMRMGSFLDSIEHNTEGEKYIDATCLITLIGFITDKSVKAVAHYLRETCFSEKVFSYYRLMDKKCYSKDMHKEVHGFDLNTKELLAECYHSFGFSDKYMTFKQAHELDFNFCYLKDELQAIDCIKDLNIDFSLYFEAERAQDKWDDEIEKPIFRLANLGLEHLENDGFNNLGTAAIFREMLVKHDTYSVLNAACLLSGDSPTEIHKFQDHLEFVQVFSEYLSFKLIIELAIKNSELTINDDKILAADLKEYLGKNGYFFKGFNDFMAIEPAQPLINNKQIEVYSSNLTATQEQAATLAMSVTSNHESEQRIAELEKQLKQAHTDNDLLRKKSATANSNEPLDDRSEKSYLNTIGLLLELMRSPRAEGGQAPFPSETDIIARVTSSEKSVYGQGTTKLEERFRDAKLVLADTRKKP